MKQDFRSAVQHILLSVGLPLISAGCGARVAPGESEPIIESEPVGDACLGDWGTQTRDGGCSSGPYTVLIDDYLDIEGRDYALYEECIESVSCPKELCLSAIDYQPSSDGFGSESFDALLACEPACNAGVRGVHVRYRLKGSCTGRKPAGLCEDVGLWARSAAGAWFAEAARLEAASVIAFARLRRELQAHGAPEQLVRAAKRAMLEEAGHATTMRMLARRYGGRVARPRVAPVEVRPLEAVARENASEGCVIEGFGAVVGSWQARASADPVVRRQMRRIAREEIGHASLAWQVDAWARSQLGAKAGRRLDELQRSTLDALSEQVASTPVPRELEVMVGLPDVPTQQRLLDAYVREMA